jgi:hypothetical protein
MASLGGKEMTQKEMNRIVMLFERLLSGLHHHLRQKKK